MYFVYEWVYVVGVSGGVIYMNVGACLLVIQSIYIIYVMRSKQMFGKALYNLCITFIKGVYY